jgi:hypothetical protein
MRVLPLCLIALSLAACNSARNPPLGAGFDAAEAAFIKTSGAGTIEGQAFLRDRTGESNVRYAAGEVVRLVPATSYAQARFSHYYGGAKFVPAASIPKVEADPEYAAYTRTTKADTKGRFSFDHVAPGRYFVTAQLIWKPKDSFLSQGGAMYDEATITGKETGPVEVILSGN